MELTEELKKRIDGMSYAELLSQWRFSPVGTPLFQGASGDYFAKRLSEVRDKVGWCPNLNSTPQIRTLPKVGYEEHVATSKRLGCGCVPE